MENTNDIQPFQEEAENGLDAMLERGIFIANGYKFVVKPIYLGEETEYMLDVPYFIYPQPKDNEEITDKDLNRYAMMLFQKSKNPKNQKIGLFERFKRWFAKTFKKNYEYYSDNPSVLGLVKWIERKVYYKGKNIKFYDLERKFGLTKSEIMELFGYFQDLSGF